LLIKRSISVCNTWQHIGGLRILVGCGEAFIQAAPLYLTFFYKRDQLATRGGIYFAMITVAGSANGLLAYAFLQNLNGVHGWLAWRWIFFVEGKDLPYLLFHP
jgi:MFS family permease